MAFGNVLFLVFGGVLLYGSAGDQALKRADRELLLDAAAAEESLLGFVRERKENLRVACRKES